MNRVLFLCTGNYYRSRFAEMFFNWHAERESLQWRADSRGLALDSANPGPISRHTLARLERLGIPVVSKLRMPVDLSLADLTSSDHIVGVKVSEHEPLLRIRFPDWLERVEFWNIHDLDCCGPDEAMPLLENEVFQLMNRLQREDRPKPVSILAL